MTGTEKILKHIEDETQAQTAALLQEARAREAEILSTAEKEGVYSIGSDVFTVGQRNDLFFSVCGREEEKVVVFTPERFLNAVDALSDAQI